MPKPAAIVLESDGAQNRGSTTPLQAARRAKTNGVRVDAVALGTANGAVHLGFGRFQNSIPVPPDPRAVAQIARVTGGQAFDATTATGRRTIYGKLAERIGG
jgi:Ca-activated chloride channel family protein